VLAAPEDAEAPAHAPQRGGSASAQPRRQAPARTAKTPKLQRTPPSAAVRHLPNRHRRRPAPTPKMPKLQRTPVSAAVRHLPSRHRRRPAPTPKMPKLQRTPVSAAVRHLPSHAARRPAPPRRCRTSSARPPARRFGICPATPPGAQPHREDAEPPAHAGERGGSAFCPRRRQQPARTAKMPNPRRTPSSAAVRHLPNHHHRRPPRTAKMPNLQRTPPSAAVRHLPSDAARRPARTAKMPKLQRTPVSAAVRHLHRRHHRANGGGPETFVRIRRRRSRTSRDHDVELIDSFVAPAASFAVSPTCWAA
jgi:hypothetical protein